MNHTMIQGLGGGGGGLAEYIAVDQQAVYPLASSIPCESSFIFVPSALICTICISVDVGALVEPLSVAWHAVKTSGLKDGNKVLVVGGGPESV